MKSLYESIKNIMEMGSRGAQTSSDDVDAEARSKMSGAAQSWRSYSQGKQNTLPKTVSKDKWNSKHDVTQTAPVAVRDNGVKPGNVLFHCLLFSREFNIHACFLWASYLSCMKLESPISSNSSANSYASLREANTI